MASTLYFLIFSGFIFAVTQSVTTEFSNEWDVERSSVNPLSYTDEDHYSPEGTTESPTLRSSRRRKNCPVDKHFTLCDANCETTCENYGKPIPCPRLCVWGCVCNLGLVKGPDNKCIKPTECPTKPQAEAKQNLLTDRKDTQSEERENPSNSEKEDPPASQSNIWPIPDRLICGKNEQFYPCPSSCPDDCNNFKNKDRKCMRICIPSCICRSGLVRSHDGKCIKPYECPKEKNFCPRGEEYSPCRSHCEGNCVRETTCQKDGRLCVSGCTCKGGLVRGPDGTCIYRTECPTNPPKEPLPKVCPENEHYDKCLAACQQNCSNVDFPLPCPRICQPGCVCKESMIRGMYGKCVETDECPKDDSQPALNPAPYTDDNYHIPESVTQIPPISERENSQFEEYSTREPSHKCPKRHRWVVCGGHCQRNCSNKDDKTFRCRPVCIPGCICEEGLVKGPDGKCIEKDKCPKTSDSEGDSFVTLNPPPYTDDDYHIPESVTKIPAILETENSQFEEYSSTAQPGPSHKCPPRHRWVVCGGHCQRNCSNKDDEDFGCRPVCIPGCICEEGLVKGPDGKCIEKDKCPKTSDSEGAPEQFPFIFCGKNENRELCPSTCPDDCNNYKDTQRKCGKLCIPACICKKGFVRGPKGKCIKPTECPDDKKDNCRKDEMFSKCKGNCEKNCSNWAFDLICPKTCSSGCVCRPGRIRGPDGKCIIFSQCPRHSSRYPGAPPPIQSAGSIIAENEGLNISDNAGCPNDNKCSISCRNYGHRYGHCTGRNSLVCSCYIENYDIVEHDDFSAARNPCPNDEGCRIICRRFTKFNIGRCTGPNNMTCDCYG